MAGIRLDARVLFGGRWKTVQQLLRPLSDKGRVKCAFADGIWRTGKALGAFDGNRPQGDPTGWQFRSSVTSVKCRYHELWLPEEAGDTYRLDRAYLTIFQSARPQDVLELMSLHCDPHDTSPIPMCDFKRGPHVHVNAKALDPMPKCHFPLNYGHLDVVMDSVDSLTKALRDAVAVIQHDVIHRYR